MLIKVKPLENECPGSLILRSSEVNGWMNPNQMLKEVNISKNNNFFSIFTTSSSWNLVSDQILYEPQNSKNLIFNSKFNSRNSNRQFRNMELPANAFSIGTPKFCPTCIKNKGYILDIWNISFIRQCNDHNVYLVDQCPSCQVKIKWNRRSISHCHNCDFDFKKTKPKSANKKITEYIKTIFDNKEVEKIIRVNNHYHCLVGMYSQFNITYQKSKLCELACLFEIDFLEYEKNIKRIILHVFKNQSIHPRIFLLPLLKTKDIALYRASTDILKTIQTNKIFKNKKYISKPKQLLSGSLTTADTEVCLGISSKISRQLIKRKLLNTIIPKSHNNPRIEIQSLNDFLMMFIYSKTPKVKYITIENAFKGRADINLGDFLKLVFDGEIETSNMQLSIGIHSIKITKENYEKHIKLKPIRTNHYYNLKEAAQTIGCSYNYLQPLVKVGFIKSKRGKFNSYYVLKTDINKFKHNYIFVFELANKYKIPRTSLAEKLMYLGCKPVSGPCIDTAPVYLFKRKDLVRVDIKLLKRLENYESKSGRKKNCESPKVITDIPISKISKELKISIQKVLQLIRQGILINTQGIQHQIVITYESYEKLKNIRADETLINLNLILNELNETKAFFINHWVNSEFVEIIDLSFEQLLNKTDFHKIKAFKEKFASSTEVANELKVNRSTCQNLIKTNRLEPDYVLNSPTYKNLYYFKRSKIPHIQSLL